MHGHPIFKRVHGFSEPVFETSHKIAEVMRERWETTDSIVVDIIKQMLPCHLKRSAVRSHALMSLCPSK
ncbi:translocase inner membrane subunit 44-2, partial [Perilla frutescens var. hirtella]